MAHESQEMIDARISAARTTLANRLSEVERRVTGTIDDTTCAVRDTAQALHATVTDFTHGLWETFDTATDRMREAVDLRHHIQNHPWESIAIATAIGLVAGGWPRQAKPRQARTDSDGAERPAKFQFHRLKEILNRELIAIGESVITSLSQLVRQNAQALLPGLIGQRPEPKSAPCGNGRHHAYADQV